MLKSYLKNLFKVIQTGDAREESYYPTLKELLDNYADSTGKTNIYVTVLPKKTEAGNPDFRIWDGKQKIVGYIEAKNPTGQSLDYLESTEQIKRYRETFPNFILTNFFEFRLYRNGSLIDQVLIGRPVIAYKVKAVPPAEKEKEFYSLLKKFFSFSLPKSYHAKSLAIELAKRTRFLKEQVILEELREEEINGKKLILGFYEAFQKYLITGLTKDSFADLYAQTITYGLFAARTRAENGFNRKLAFDLIPHTIGILRDVFRFISLGDLPPQMEWIVDDISEVLAVTNVNQILHEFYYNNKGSDPVIHFYETFLAEYNPEERERRGVYYTPEAVVSYIARSLNFILKEKFNREDGFATNSVTVLDPAAGTMTFLAHVTRLAVNEFKDRYGEGGKEQFVKEHILKNFYAFELMIAPYTVGHIKIAFILEELGYKLQKDERFKLYITNTLEMENIDQISIPGLSSLTEESYLAGKVKKETPLLVIMGNPPYSMHSANFGNWILKEIREYYKVDDKPLNEKNPKGLQDDYVKFIRFAQWKIDQIGEGILGFITNHTYLDGKIFRGMRNSLIKSFNEIYLLNLHGNTLKKEKCPDGSKDENVFDIKQGVAIGLFIKNRKNQNSKVFYSDLFGPRENKNQWLLNNDISTTSWQEIKPGPDYYFFVPRSNDMELYQKFYSITDIFNEKNVGIVTSRDDFVIDFSRDSLIRKIIIFRDKKNPADFIRQAFKLNDKKSWKLEIQREKIIQDKKWEEKIMRISYRPFDFRWIFYHDEMVERPRKEIMRHMMVQDNIGIIANGQIKLDSVQHFWVSNLLVDYHILETANANAYLFPLYLYPQTNLFNHSKQKLDKELNIKVEVLELLSSCYGTKSFAPEDIIYYIYGVFYSNTYREIYKESLKGNFPRIPFTKNYDLFLEIGNHGRELVNLHLLKSEESGAQTAKFQGMGNNRIEKVIYQEGKVFINNNQYFEGITEDVWEYQIGGYQILDKWLKYRKKKALTLEEIKLYCKIVYAIKRTIEIQEELDLIYPEIEKSLLTGGKS